MTLLPDERDYPLLTAFVMATYVCRVFDEFPVLLVTGPRASGKSELTANLVEASYNGSIMGQGSAAALVRLVRECGGLVALDDAEGLAVDGTEIGQALKQGYKRTTAIKQIVGKGGRVEQVDFFGPRILCNTRGVEPILGSRCLLVPTRPASRPASHATGVGAIDWREWRDGMHALAMSRVADFQAAYRERSQAIVDRRGELLAPLLAVADVIASASMVSALEARSA